VLSFASSPLHPQEKAPDTAWIGWMDPRTDLDAVAWRKIPITATSGN